MKIIPKTKQQELEDLQQSITVANNDFACMKSNIQEASSVLENLKLEINALENTRSNVQEEVSCEKERIESIREKISNYNSELFNVQERFLESMKELSAFQLKSSQKTKFLSESISLLEEKSRRLSSEIFKKESDLQEKFKSSEESLSSILKQIEERNIMRLKLDDEIASKNKQLESIEDKANQLSEIVNKKQELITSISLDLGSLENEKQTKVSEMDVLNEKIKALLLEADDAEKSVQEKKEQILRIINREQSLKEYEEHIKQAYEKAGLTLNI